MSGLAQVRQYIADAWLIRVWFRFVIGQAPGIGFRLLVRINRGQVRHIDRRRRAGKVWPRIYGQRHSQSSVASVGAQLLVHCGGYEGLPCQFWRHLSLHSKPTAPGRVRIDFAVSPYDVSVQNIEALKRATDLPFETAAKLDDHWLPLNFGRVADFIRVHFAPPRVLLGAKLESLSFVPRGAK